jgi:hypothetical protein
LCCDALEHHSELRFVSHVTEHHLVSVNATQACNT